MQPGYLNPEILKRCSCSAQTNVAARMEEESSLKLPKRRSLDTHHLCRPARKQATETAICHLARLAPFIRVRLR